MKCKKQLEFVKIENDEKKKQLEEEIRLLICAFAESTPVMQSSAKNNISQAIPNINNQSI